MKCLAKFPLRSQIMGAIRSSTVSGKFLHTSASTIIRSQVVGNGSHKNVLFIIRMICALGHMTEALIHT